MTTGQTLLEILKYTLPALIVLIATSIIVSKFLVNGTRRKELAIFKEGMDTTLRLRLQAYERLSVYAERISPRSLISREYQTGMTVRELQAALTQSIRTEYEHNLSQQIYVSTQVWKTIEGVKEQEMAMINQIAGSLNPEASAKELHKRIMDFTLTNENPLPYEVALDVINNEAKVVLSMQG